MEQPRLYTLKLIDCGTLSVTYDAGSPHAVLNYVWVIPDRTTLMLDVLHHYIQGNRHSISVPAGSRRLDNLTKEFGLRFLWTD